MLSWKTLLPLPVNVASTTIIYISKSFLACEGRTSGPWILPRCSWATSFLKRCVMRLMALYCNLGLGRGVNIYQTHVRRFWSGNLPISIQWTFVSSSAMGLALIQVQKTQWQLVNINLQQCDMVSISWCSTWNASLHKFVQDRFHDSHQSKVSRFTMVIRHLECVLSHHTIAYLATAC